MKTRILHTKIWSDDWFCSLSRSTSFIFIYILTCPENNLSGLFEMSDRVLAFNTRSTQLEVEKAKKELEPRVIFYKGWVKITNTTKYNNYVTNEKMNVALAKELDLTPEEIQKYMNEYDTSIHTSIYTPNNHKSEIRNHKSEIINQKLEIKDDESLREEDFQEIADKYNVPLSFVLSKWDDLQNWCDAKGKSYKNYKAALRNWVKTDVIKIHERKQHEKKQHAGINVDELLAKKALSRDGGKSTHA